MYTHPASLGDDVIEQLAAGPPLVPYIDLPLQHISDSILASMGRRVGRADVENLLRRLRAAAAHIAIRTSFIVGYPGESEGQFEELLAFVRQVRFDHVGVFMYSPEPATRAADLPGRTPADVVRQRWERLMKAAEALAGEMAVQRIGQVLQAIVDGPDGCGHIVARHGGQAPEVDSVVLLPHAIAGGQPPPASGSFVRVRITAAEGCDLVGEIVSS
jgi:ribosomal protein S12 methylthiotransferase